jgi:hypothetical protein
MGQDSTDQSIDVPAKWDGSSHIPLETAWICPQGISVDHGVAVAIQPWDAVIVEEK